MNLAKLEKLAKKIVLDDRFQELKTIMPKTFHLVDSLEKDLEYGTLHQRFGKEGGVSFVAKYLQLVWKFLTLSDPDSLMQFSLYGLRYDDLEKAQKDCLNKLLSVEHSLRQSIFHVQERS